MATVEPLAEEHAERDGKRSKWPQVLVPLGIAVYFFAAWYFGWDKVRAALLGADPRLVAAAGAVSLAANCVRILKWRLALGAHAHPVGLFFLSRATGVWSPGRIGEFLPLLWRRHRSARVGGWILLDRVLEIVTALALGVIGLGFTSFLSTPIYIALVVATTAACVGALVCLTQHRWMDAVARRLAAGTRLRLVADTLTRTSIEIHTLRRQTPVLLAITLAAKAADLFAVVLIFRALGVSVGFMLTAASKCALAIVSFVPITPMATGVPHAVQGWMMNAEAGVAPETVVASVGIEAGLMLIIFTLSVMIASRAIKRAVL